MYSEWIGWWQTVGGGPSLLFKSSKYFPTKFSRFVECVGHTFTTQSSWNEFHHIVNVNHCDHDDGVNPKGISHVTTLGNMSHFTTFPWMLASMHWPGFQQHSIPTNILVHTAQKSIQNWAQDTFRGTCHRVPTAETPPQPTPGPPTLRWHRRRLWRKHWIFCARHFVSRPGRE